MLFIATFFNFVFLSFLEIEQEPTLSDSTPDDDEGDVVMTWESEAVPLAKGNFRSELIVTQF